MYIVKIVLKRAFLKSIEGYGGGVKSKKHAHGYVLPQPLILFSPPLTPSLLSHRPLTGALTSPLTGAPHFPILFRMKILNCELCACKVGEVEKGILRKSMIHICTNCWGTVKLWRDMASKRGSYKSDDFNDLFGSLFGKF